MLSIMLMYALLTPFPLTVQCFFYCPPLPVIEPQDVSQKNKKSWPSQSLSINLIQNWRDDPNVAESN